MNGNESDERGQHAVSRSVSCSSPPVLMTGKRLFINYLHICSLSCMANSRTETYVHTYSYIYLSPSVIVSVSPAFTLCLFLCLLLPLPLLLPNSNLRLCVTLLSLPLFRTPYTLRLSPPPLSLRVCLSVPSLPCLTFFSLSRLLPKYYYHVYFMYTGM